MPEHTKNIDKESPHPSKKTSFAGDVFTLVSGTTFAQILTISVAPILTRIFSPEDFGLQALFLSIAGIISVIACLRYELSIMLPESDEEAANLLALSLLITLIISILTVPVIWFGGQPIQNVLKAPHLGACLWLVPLYVFVNGVFLSLNYWNSRTKHFRRLSVARIMSSIASAGTQLFTGFAGYVSGESLIGANLVGQTVSTFILGGQIWREDKYLFLKRINLEKMTSGLKRYKKFPLLDSWSALLNTVSWQLPTFLLAYFFSQSTVGFYSLGFQLLQLPMSFIGSSISQVFFQRASEAKSEGSLASLVENVFKLLVVVGMFPILILAIVGSDVFSVVLGKIWAEAGVYSQILSLWVLVWFISSPLSTLWIVLEKQEFGFRITLINLITRFLSLGIGGFFRNIYLALFLFAFSGIFVYGYLCLRMMTDSGVGISRIENIVLHNFVLFLPFGTILVILKLLEINQLVIVGLSFLLIVTYYLYVLKMDTQLNFLSNKFGIAK